MMITQRAILFLIFAFFALASAVTQAADIPLRGPISFDSFDANGDKMISPQEFVETHNQRKKMRADAKMPVGPMPGDQAFTYFDTNGDNLISAEELDAGRAATQRGGMQQGDMQRGGGMRPGMRPGMYRGRQMPTFDDFDLNDDGELSNEEFYEARAQRMRQRAEQGYMMRNAANAPAFETIDTNGDGKITPDELSAFQAMMRQQMRRPGY